MSSPHPVRTGAVVALALLAVTACGNDASAPVASAPTPTVSAPPSPPASPLTPTATATPTAVPEAGSTFDIAVAGGQVTGDTGRLKVAVGDKVAIRVTSDTADEVHLHGYDISVPVTPEQPAELLFEATIPGVFELELEDGGVALASLQVS